MIEKIIPIFGVLALFSFACHPKTAVPIQDKDIVIKRPSGKSLPIENSVAIKIDEERRNRIIRINGGILLDGELMSEAAYKVFLHVFKHVYDYKNQLFSPNILFTISADADIGTFFGSYSVMANVNVIILDSNISLSYSSEGESQSDFLHDSNALRNAYIIAFRKIADQMLQDNRFLTVVNNGNR